MLEIKHNLNTRYMLNVRSKKRLNKDYLSKLEEILKDHLFDFKGQLVYDRDGVAKIKMSGKVIPLEVSGERYSLELSLSLLVRKEYNWATDQEFGGNVQAWDIVLKDSMNQKIDLTLDAYDSIKNSLENNVLV
jgi:hypothetical protein|tara:strand:+ start:111 stop:509 length:399 start_codon:yes stop_codon:yes gene_type:complete